MGASRGNQNAAKQPEDPQFALDLDDRRMRLTAREAEMITLICRGVSPKEAGARMRPKCSRRNVHQHLTRVKDKLGARTTYQACAIYGSLHPNIGALTHPSVVGTNHMITKEK